MPGYHLLEHGTPLPGQDDAAGRPLNRLGFLDFLRELSGDEPAIPRFWNVTVVGLEEVIFAAGAEAEALAREIHHRLRAAASCLEKRLADVYILFHGRLQRGDDLWADYRGARLPISATSSARRRRRPDLMGGGCTLRTLI